MIALQHGYPCPTHLAVNNLGLFPPSPLQHGTPADATRFSSSNPPSSAGFRDEQTPLYEENVEMVMLRNLFPVFILSASLLAPAAFAAPVPVPGDVASRCQPPGGWTIPPCCP